MRENSVVTADLSQWGNRELHLAVDLLNAYMKQGADFLDDGITLNFNTNSGCVFLCDEDFRVGMMNRDKLEEWFTCPVCGWEGFAEDMEHGEDDKECQEYLKQSGVIED